MRGRIGGNHIFFLKQVTGLIEASLATSAFSLLFFSFVCFFFNYISVFQFIQKYILHDYQIHNFELKMVASFAMNLKFS